MNYAAQPLTRVVKLLSKVPCFFDAARWVLEGGYHEHRALLTRHLPTKALHVLDLGCGTGIHANHFDPKTYVGIDISSDYVLHARQKLSQYRFEVMDATRLQFSERSFDAVIISGVLHHLDSTVAQQVLAEASRVLKPNGLLLVWEDIPTRDSHNLVGRLAHQLDVGEYIRPSDGYEELLSGFDIEVVEFVRSGFMDYVAFKCRKLEATESSMFAVDCDESGELAIHQRSLASGEVHFA